MRSVKWRYFQWPWVTPSCPKWPHFPHFVSYIVVGGDKDFKFCTQGLIQHRCGLLRQISHAASSVCLDMSCKNGWTDRDAVWEDWLMWVQETIFITFSLFYSRLKTCHFHKSFPRSFTSLPDCLHWPFLLSYPVFSGRELAFTFAICYGRPVCLSVVCLWRWCALLRRLNFSAFFSPYDSPGTLLLRCQKSLVGDASFPLKFSFKATDPLSNSKISTNIGS